MMMFQFNYDSLHNKHNEADLREKTGHSRSAQESMVVADDDDNDDEYSSRSDDQDSRSTTLNENYDDRAYSTSPARLDGAGILRDLNEMSECTNRINSILEYGSSSAPIQNANNISQRRSHLRSLSPNCSDLNTVTANEQDDDHDYNDEEVD